MLSQGAFNALLKTLEEPPSYAIFILATTEKHKVLPTILSRCQVYDFTRITVADIISHLQYIAGQEGITVSEEALNVVAQKADGGLRDALSIFDQLVAFCGNEIRYEQAIEVLNVLDSDYYFRLVDTLLQGNTAQALLILNEVLQRGFDAGNFITGFAQHLRDVLVSKDAATVQLLETSDAIRKHYADQAAHCDASWIFRALDVVNTCDVNYRTARNKRLTVELCLVKLSQLAQPQTTVQPQTAPAQTKPQAQTTAQPQTRPQAQTASKVPTIPSMPNIPSINLTAKPSNNAEGANKAEGSNSEAINPAEGESRPFTLDQLLDAWAGLKSIFAGEPRLMAVLLEHHPQLIDAEHAVLTLANPWQQTEFKKYGKQVMDHIRKALHNSKLQLSLKIAEYDTSSRAYTAEEKYKVLLGQNAELGNLKSALGLQLE